MAGEVGVLPCPMSKAEVIKNQKYPTAQHQGFKSTQLSPGQHLHPMYLSDGDTYVSHVWWQVKVIHVEGIKCSLLFLFIDQCMCRPSFDPVAIFVGMQQTADYFFFQKLLQHFTVNRALCSHGVQACMHACVCVCPCFSIFPG